MSVATDYRWHDGELRPVDHSELTTAAIEAADSWLVTEGRALALHVHRERFLTSISRHRYLQTDPAAFWDAALTLIPREGDWFPRVELQSRDGVPALILRLRPAPERSRSLAVTTWTGPDPRTMPRVKGPDLEAMARIRTSAKALGADDAVLLSPDGYVVETAVSALLWWRGEILCGPPAHLDRVASVTARTALTLATAIGIETWEEAVTPAELDGTELWALNALHGVRLVRDWIGGPELAARTGRLAAWALRLEALRKPLWVGSPK